MQWRWAAILLTICALTACDDASGRGDEVVAVTTSSLIAQSSRLNDDLDDAEKANLVDGLADVVDADPVAAADRFERDIGGGAALGRYTRAMVDGGQAERLGRQVAVVLRDGDPNRTITQALSASEPRDASAWFRAAEKAGFFAGSVASAFDRGEVSRDAVAAFAEALGSTAPGQTSSVREWLRACGADGGCGLTGAAEAAYQRAFDQGDR